MGRFKRIRGEGEDSRTPRTRAEKATDRRKAIVAAALDEFSDRGFAAARIEDIAKRAGVAKGTIYLYFKDKEALFEGIVSEIIVPAGIGEFSAIEPSPGESARAFAARIILPLIRKAAVARAGDVVRLIIADGPRFPALADVYYRLVVQNGVRLVRKIARYAAETGELPGNTLEQFPQLFIAPALVGLIWRSQFERFQHLDVEAMLEAHLDVLFGPPPARRGKRKT